MRLQTHLDEFFARTGLILFLWILCSIPWFLNIDSVLNFFLNDFNPCDDECLNLYQPEKWSEIRWISSGILGFVTIIPLICQQFWSFANPGLTDSERRMLATTLFFTPLILVLVTYFSVTTLIPEIFQVGHEMQIEYGFVAKYDVVTLMSFTTGVIWMEILIISACAVMISSGITGNLDSSNANWWRIRTYGFMSLVILLSFYERTTNGFAMMIIAILIVELISRPWTTKESKYQVVLSQSFDKDGEIIEKLFLCCGCENFSKEDYSNENSILYLPDVCVNARLKDDLYRIISYYSPTHLSIINCKSNEFIETLKSSLPGKIVESINT